MKYVVVIEKGTESWGAYVPDLPGCGVVAETREEVLKLIREAVDLHIEGLRETGRPIPEAQSTIEYVQV
jgi:predicted RNase H-like HicB family nuclease